MTSIQQFIEKALAGGWRPDVQEFSIIRFYERHFEYQLRSIALGRSSPIRMMVYEAVLLDPKAWQAVGKVERWYEGFYGPEWLHHMRKMIDALAEGHTLEAYVQSVLKKAQSPRHDNR
jgi:hypothetical protein